MGYLDYTLAKLNASKALEDTRYREKALEEQNKAAFLSSLVGLVPKGIDAYQQSVAAEAAKDEARNKLLLQEAMLTGGDNTLAGTNALTGANTLAPTTPVPDVGQVVESGSEGIEGPPTDTSPNYNPYAEAGFQTQAPTDAADQAKIEASGRRIAESNKELQSYNDAYARAKGYIDSKDFLLKTAPPIQKDISPTGSPAPTVEPGLAASLSKLAPGLTSGARSMGTTSAFPNVNVTTPDIGPSSPVDLSLREREGAVVPGEISAPAAAPIAVPPVAAVPVAATPIVDPLAKLGAPAPIPSPIPSPVTTRAMESAALDTRRGGPTMPGVVGDENIEGEAPASYRKRMEAKGYNPKKVNELIKKYYVTGSGTVDITEDTGTGGPRNAKPFQIGGDFNAPGPVAPIGGPSSGGFGGAPPEPEKPWIKARKTTAPTTVAEEAKATAETGKTPIERLRDEEKVKSEDFNKRVRSYKRIGNADFKEPNVEKLAEKAVNEIFTKRPAGNPITEMINRMSGGNQMTSENERIMRSIAKKTIMKNIIAERTAIADKDQAEFLATAKLELDAATAQGKSLGLTTTKKQIPNSARLELDSQREADTMLNDVRDKAYQIAEKSGTLPFGPGRFLTEARIKKAAGVIGSSADSVSGGFLGLSAGQSKARALELDQGLLSSAFQAMDFSDLPEDQQELLSLTKQSVQILGKAREGGKLTDADYMKYLETLFNSSNPAGFVRSLEETIDRNANRYNNNLEYFNTNYGDDLRMYEPGGRREQGADIDWNQVKETPLGAAAAGMSPVASSGGTKKAGGSTPKKNKPTADD